jgi:hypothetical protein
VAGINCFPNSDARHAARVAKHRLAQPHTALDGIIYTM